MTLAYLAFTDRGFALAQTLAAALGGTASRSGRPLNLRDWTAEHFVHTEGLVYVGAVGIAVRAIAPHLESKAADPAVVAIDEYGRFAVALASGHLGGANELAARVARVCGAQPVITTATDLNRRFAADSWAKAQNCAVLDTDRIKTVSAKLLAGGTVRVNSGWPVAGSAPAGVTLTEEADCDVKLALRFAAEETALRLAPRTLVLGIGCRKGTSAQALERAVTAFLERNGYPAQAVCAAATIDLKREEAGLLALCRSRGWPLLSFTAEELRQAEGEFTASAFVQQVTGVDNVCERAAVRAGGKLLVPKTAADGITLALAAKPFAPTWNGGVPNEG